MHIAVHTSHYPYDEHVPGYVSGGGERVALAVSEAISARGHDVSVYTAAKGRSEMSTVEGVEVNRYMSLATIGSTSVSPGQFLPVREPVDVVHVHNTTPPGVLSGVLHAKVVDAPLVLTHHGNDRYVPDGSVIKRALDYVYAEKIVDRVLDAATAITIPSMSYIEESPRISRVRSKLTEIPNGVEVGEYDRPGTRGDAEESFGIEPNDDVVAFVGDMIRKKGPDLIVKAAETVSDVTFVVAGNGPLLEELRAQAPPNVVLPGYVSEASKVALLNRADLFALPSRTHTEVFPIVLLEAYASRTPVVASDLGTFDDLVSSDVGRRFVRENVESLASTIEGLFEGDSNLEMMAGNARDLAGEYEWSAIARQYESLFESVQTENARHDGSKHSVSRT